jgi:hypothetical protein
MDGSRGRAGGRRRLKGERGAGANRTAARNHEQVRNVTRDIEQQEQSGVNASPWKTAGGAAQHAHCGVKVIYREVAAGRLRAARIGGRRELRFRVEWVDERLERTAQPVEVRR